MATFGPKDPHKRLADIFSKMKPGQRDVLLGDLEGRDHVAAARIKLLMFTFDDLRRIDARGIQELLRRVDHDTLALALKGAKADLAALMFANMSERAATLLQDDIEALGPVRTSDVDAARAAVAETAKALSDEGSIVIQDGDDKYVT